MAGCITIALVALPVEIPAIESSGVILATPEGYAAVNLRDNKPGIASPNMLALFGGMLEPGEDALACIVREIWEETGLSIAPDEFIPLGTVRRHIDAIPGMFHEHTAIGHFFLARNIDPASIKLKEGQGIEIITSLQDLERRDNVAPFAFGILRQFFMKQIKEAPLVGAS